MGLYQIAVEDTAGKKIILDQYKGEVLLIVNTATNCVFTPQYSILEGLQEKYHGKGFEVLDFPCSQFLNQAPGTIEEINQFCDQNFKTTFPRFAKTNVNGPDESILYSYLKCHKHGFFGKRIKWNFTKFLVDREGHVIARYAPSDGEKPLAEGIEKLL